MAGTLNSVKLKLGKFQAKYRGQMELYLKWLNRYERQEDENAPIGLILCTGGRVSGQYSLFLSCTARRDVQAAAANK
jgi:hypothetical protein